MPIDWGLANTHVATDIADRFEAEKAKTARRGALAMYATDPQGAINSALSSGDLTAATSLQDMQHNTTQAGYVAQDRAAAQAASARKLSEDEQAKHWAHARDAAQLVKAAREKAISENKDPNAAGIAAFDGAKDVLLNAAGWTPEEYEQSRQYAGNPQALDAIIGAANEELEFRHIGDGYDVAVSKRTGKVVQQYLSPTVKLGPGDIIGANPALAGAGGSPAASVAGEPLAERVPAPPGSFDQFKSAVRGQEAPAGQAGVGISGPQTPYGQAHGQMQVLDSTGQGVAQKLGIAWRPDLMRGSSPEAAAYQDQIGTAYAKEAWDASGGDPVKAASYYHGGPNPRMWGPKTQQYAQTVAGRMGAPVVPGQAASASVPAGPPPGALLYNPKVVAPEKVKTFHYRTPDEVKAMGYAPGTVIQTGPDGDKVMQAPSEAERAAAGQSGKMSPQDAKAIAGARTAAAEARSMSQDVERFVQLNGQLETGPNPAQRAAHAFDPRWQEMKSLSDKLVPAMRQGLPGAASDRDVAMFRSATVGVEKTGPANQAIATAIKAGAKRLQDYSSFLEQWQQTHGSLLGASEQWAVYAEDNPLFTIGKGGNTAVRQTTPWRRYFGLGGTPRPGAKPSAGPKMSGNGWTIVGVSQ